mmetsp:Transcript_17913/g.24782  ORF Transcript_17913/g.24782 Transcript_17913/m.24782 type:complete len:121 (+) Transcript_17913:599-961(+)
MAQALEIVCGVFVAQCNDDKFAHIDEAERAKVVKECTEAKTWLTEKMAQQEALPKSAPLVVYSKEINAKKETVERFCKPIMSKPKPKPVEQPNDAEAMDTEGEKMAENGDGPSPMQADLD